MNDVQKKALKDLLHLLVDNEELPLIKDFVSKLPAAYASVLDGILDVGGPAIIKAEDAVIDKI